MSREPPVTAAELASRLGIHRETLYRTLPTLYDDGLPKPLSRRGNYRWDRQSIDAWFGRNHPTLAAERCELPAPGRPAADADAAEWRQYLARAYPPGGK